jgi:allantoin racemase
MSVPGLLEAIRRGEAAGADGHVIACFGDPGLLAAREIAQGPVLGIAEAAMRAATMVATGFSIVTTLPRTRIIARHLADRYGLAAYCRRIRAIDLPVLALEDDGAVRDIILAECRRAKAEDDIGAVVLGCAGMADLPALLSNELGLPVIDGVTVAVKFIEGFVSLNLTTSKHGDLSMPPPKPYVGELAAFALF